MLNLSANQLTTLPPEIGDLGNLQVLLLADNQLTILPPEISDLSSLQSLDLRNNQLATLPVEITRLINLKIFDDSTPIVFPGLRLCGNPLTIDDPAIEAFVMERDEDWAAGCPEVESP
jgi:Leucine-rich repeat (LRR) protein